MESFVLFLCLTIYSGVQCTTVGNITGNIPILTTDDLNKPNLKIPATTSTADNQSNQNDGNTTISPGPEITTVHNLINNTGPENVTIDLNDTKTPFKYSHSSTPCGFLIESLLIIYTTLAVAGLVVVLNFFVMYIFLQKQNRSPLTILLSCLAFSDALTAISFFVKNVIAIQSGNIQIYDSLTLWLSEYQVLTIAFQYLGIFALAFHHISVLLTAVLSLQKAVSMVFPIWSKIHLNNKAAILTSLCVVLFSVLSYLPVAVGYLYSFSEQPVGTCHNIHDYLNIPTFIATGVIYVLCIAVVVVCTLIVCCKLTCFRGSVQGIHTTSVQKRNQRSALIVVSICIVFIISEIIPFCNWVLFLFDHVGSFTTLKFFAMIVIEYSTLSILIGFSLNFIVYITMCRHLRETLVAGFRHMCIKYSSCKKNNI